LPSGSGQTLAKEHEMEKKFAVQVRVPKAPALPKEVGIVHECPARSDERFNYELDKATIYIHTFNSQLEAESFRMGCLTEYYEPMGR